MMLLTKENKKALPPLGTQDGLGADAIAYVKFFDPQGSYNWYATEFDPTQDRFFGFVTSSHCEDGEFGYFMLSELKAVRGRFGLNMERDRWFEPSPIRKVMTPAALAKWEAYA